MPSRTLFIPRMGEALHAASTERSADFLCLKLKVYFEIMFTFKAGNQKNIKPLNMRPQIK